MVPEIILYFAWADQRDQAYFIFHRVTRALYEKIVLCGRSVQLCKLLLMLLGQACDPYTSKKMVQAPRSQKSMWKYGPIWTNGISFMHSQKFMLKIGLETR